MNYITSGLSPKEIFENFENISAIPRGSGNEAAIAEYIADFAEKRGLFCIRDAANNVFVRKAASDCSSGGKAVLLQGHIDMVCEKNEGTVHDFEKDGIKLVLNGDVLSADGTTLGGDDGVAVAIMLALLDSSDIPHPELECLFTSGEEIGLLGMEAFDAASIKSRMMINLDSAGEGVATVSCAGGVRSDIAFEAKKLEEISGTLITLRLSGFAGGHSGENINDGRISASKLLARLIWAAKEASDINIVSVCGGNKDNAIPREAKCELFASDPDAVMSAVKALFDTVMASEATKADLGGAFSVEFSEASRIAMSRDDSVRLAAILALLPYGVLAMSADIPNFVETSSNIGIISSCGGKVDITTSSRSSVDSKLDMVMASFDALGAVADVSVSHHARYPGWAAASYSPLAEIYKKAYKELFGVEGKTMGIHAGLECGILKSRIPDMDIISIGPELEDIHTPDEKLSVSSFARLYETVKAILAKLCAAE